MAIHKSDPLVQKVWGPLECIKRRFLPRQRGKPKSTLQEAAVCVVNSGPPGQPGQFSPGFSIAYPPSMKHFQALQEAVKCMLYRFSGVLRTASKHSRANTQPCSQGQPISQEEVLNTLGIECNCEVAIYSSGC